jgi:chromosome segregation ATPase
VRGRIQTHYVCSGYVSSGPGICAGFRIATGFLDDAIVDGIQKRLDQVVNPEELRRRLRNLLAQEAQSVDDVARLTRRLADTRQKIERLVEVLASGTEPIPSVRAALVGLERDRERVERELIAAQAREVTSADIEAVTGNLLRLSERSGTFSRQESRRNGRPWCGRSSGASQLTGTRTARR